MIYIGTDEGIYRWYPGTPWPIFHGLQDRGIVSLDAPGTGILVVVDDVGRVLESENNGMDWRELPLPEGIGRPLAVTVLGTPAEIVLTTRPLGLYRRPFG